jgi:hypothetical protein
MRQRQRPCCHYWREKQRNGGTDHQKQFQRIRLELDSKAGHVLRFFLRDNNRCMVPDRYASFLPLILDWIHNTLDRYASASRPVRSFNFSRLPRYLPADILNSTNVVITENPPRPPLASLGLSEFAAFENQPVDGITYLDTYFVTPGAARDESVHFHELVHVVQWQILGPKDFLLLYAAGLADQGYPDSPLERMAYEHQRRFDAGQGPYPVDIEVRVQTSALR